MDHILFSDEAPFHICGKINGITYIWANEKPKEFTEWERGLPEVNVWLGMTK
jgi:hypothetical protein